jgi:TP901 family phage tail tape measure protein
MAEKVTIEFGLKDNASGKASVIGNAFSNIAQKAKALLNPIDLAILAVTGFGVAMVKQFNKFAELETKMVNVGNLYGATRDQVNDLTTELIDLSRQTPQNLDDLADSLFDVVSAGVPAAESVEFLGEASKLATAGVTSTSVAVDGLTSAMNAYQIEFSKAGEVSDKFFAAQQKGKTTIAELSNSIGAVAPVAASVGVSLDALLGSISTLTLNGIKTSEAATQMKAALSNVIKPSQQAADLSEALGLAFNSQALEAKGLSGFLKDVTEKTGGNTDALAKLFGSVEALNAVLALSKDGFKSLDEVQKAVTESAGATDAAYKENLKTFSAQWKLIKNNVDALWSGLIRILIPAVTATLSAFNKMFNFVNTSIGKVQKKWSKFTSFFKKNNKEIAKSSEDTAEKQIKKETEVLEKKKSLENERLEEIKAKRAEEVAAIMASMDEEEIAEETKTLNAIERYKMELAEKQSMRDVDHQEKITMLEDYLSKAQAGTDIENKLQLELYKTKKALRDQTAKDEEEQAKKAAKLAEKQKEKEKAIFEERVGFFKKTGDILEKNNNDILKSMGEGIKNFIKEEINMFFAKEQAKLAAIAITNWANPIGWAAGGQIILLEAEKTAAIGLINAINFADGGVVPGSSFSGDKIPANLNSGELVLNRPQQANIGDTIYKLANNPMKMGGTNDRAVLKRLERIEAAILKPAEIKLNGDSFARATYNKQKTMLRTGQISSRGR